KRMGSGIPILETVTKRCKVERLSRFEFRIILVQGLNRQIRRMCEYLGYEVVALQRIRIMNLELGDLPVGEWRDLTAAELKTLRESVKDSDGLPQVYQKDGRQKVVEPMKPEKKRQEERNLKREQNKTAGRRRRGPN
ncbi:MAG TPA: 23S rRNA pseudouridine synthase F, partial [Aequorivita sp.]|nr:23S rRNA pseudouridine synthase F [Aequorivita sp.]